MRKVLAVLFFLLVVVEGSSAGELRVPLASRGNIVLNVPDGWTQQVTRPRADLPPTVRLAPATGSAFQILITPIWPANAGIPQATPGEIRGQVRRAAEAAKSQSVERELPVVDLSAPGVVGAYYSATDRAPKPNEYKHLTQGMLGVSDLRVTFTILVNGEPSPVVEKALQMLRTIRRESGTNGS